MQRMLADVLNKHLAAALDDPAIRLQTVGMDAFNKDYFNSKLPTQPSGNELTDLINCVKDKLADIDKNSSYSADQKKLHQLVISHATAGAVKELLRGLKEANFVNTLRKLSEPQYLEIKTLILSAVIDKKFFEALDIEQKKHVADMFTESLGTFPLRHFENIDSIEFKKTTRNFVLEIIKNYDEPKIMQMLGDQKDAYIYGAILKYMVQEKMITPDAPEFDALWERGLSLLRRDLLSSKLDDATFIKNFIMQAASMWEAILPDTQSRDFDPHQFDVHMGKIQELLNLVDRRGFNVMHYIFFDMLTVSRHAANNAEPAYLESAAWIVGMLGMYFAHKYSTNVMPENIPVFSNGKKIEVSYVQFMVNIWLHEIGRMAYYDLTAENVTTMLRNSLNSPAVIGQMSSPDRYGATPLYYLYANFPFVPTIGISDVESLGESDKHLLFDAFLHVSHRGNAALHLLLAGANLDDGDQLELIRALLHSLKDKHDQEFDYKALAMALVSNNQSPASTLKTKISLIKMIMSLDAANGNFYKQLLSFLQKDAAKVDPRVILKDVLSSTLAHDDKMKLASASYMLFPLSEENTDLHDMVFEYNQQEAEKQLDDKEFPPGVKIGIELEVAVNVKFIDRNHEFFLQTHGINVTSDQSIRHTKYQVGLQDKIEYVTVVVDSPAKLRMVLNAIEELKSRGTRVNASSGLHLHYNFHNYAEADNSDKTIIDLFAHKLAEQGVRGFSLDDPATQEKLRTQIITNLHKNMQVFDAMYSGAILRQGSGFNDPSALYNKPILDTNFALNYLKNHSLEEFFSVERQRDEYRKYSVNIMSLIEHGTIEFRAHEGTLEVPVISAWINFCHRMLDLSMQEVIDNPSVLQEKQAVPQSKSTFTPGYSANVAKGSSITERVDNIRYLTMALLAERQYSQTWDRGLGTARNTDVLPSLKLQHGGNEFYIQDEMQKSPLFNLYLIMLGVPYEHEGHTASTIAQYKQIALDKGLVTPEDLNTAMSELRTLADFVEKHPGLTHKINPQRRQELALQPAVRSGPK